MADLNWNFNLQDSMSGPAGAIAASLKAMETRLASIDGKLKGTESATKHAGAEMKSFGSQVREAFSAVDHGINVIGHILEPFKRLGEAGIEGIFKFEEASVSALSFKENTLASFKTLLGSAKEAEDFFMRSALLGKASPFKTKDVVSSWKTLLGAGFTKEEVPNVFAGIGDVSAMSGFSTDVIQRLQLAFAEIMSTGRLEGRQLRMVLIDAAGAGVSAPAIATQLAKNLNIPFEDALARLHGDAVDSRTAIKAILDTIAVKAGGGILGGGAKAYENTFSGVMSTLESTFDEFFYLVEGGTEKVLGFNALKGAMMNLKSAMQNTTPEGKHLQDAVTGAFDTITVSIFGALGGPDGLANMKSFIDKAAFGIENLSHIIGYAFEGAKAAVGGFLDALDIAPGRGLAGFFEGPLSPERLEQIRLAFVAFGAEAGVKIGTLADNVGRLAGHLDSLTHALGMVGRAANLFPTMEDAARYTREDELWDRAKKVREEAEQRRLGGAFGAGGDWHEAPPSAGMEKTPGGGAGVAQTNTFHVSVDASGAKDPGEVARRTASGMRDQIPPLLRRMGTQAGVE